MIQLNKLLNLSYNELINTIISLKENNQVIILYESNINQLFDKINQCIDKKDSNLTLGMFKLINYLINEESNLKFLIKNKIIDVILSVFYNIYFKDVFIYN